MTERRSGKRSQLRWLTIVLAGALAVAWGQLTFDDKGVATNLAELVAEPLLNLSCKYIDAPAIVLGLLKPIDWVAVVVIAVGAFFLA